MLPGKIIAGDFPANTSLLVNNGKIGTLAPGLSLKKLLLTGIIQSVELVTEQNKSDFLGPNGWATEPLSSVALRELASILSGTNKKEVCFACRLTNGQKFVGIAGRSLYDLFYAEGLRSQLAAAPNVSHAPTQPQKKKGFSLFTKILLGFTGFLFALGALVSQFPTPKSSTQQQTPPARLAQQKSKAAPPVAKVKPKLDVAKIIKQDMDKNFGVKGTEPEWYFAIEKLEVEGDTLKVHTDMLKNPLFNEIITQTCGAASTYVFREDHPEWGLSRLDVYGRGGQILVWRNRLSDTCKP